MLLDRQRRAAGLIALLFCAASIYAGWPVAVPLILGTWIGTLARPWALKLGGEGSGRGKAAGVLTAALLLALLGIFALLYTTLDQALLGLADQLTTSKGIEGALEALVTPYAKDPDAARLKAFAKRKGFTAREPGAPRECIIPGAAGSVVPDGASRATCSIQVPLSRACRRPGPSSSARWRPRPALRGAPDRWRRPRSRGTAAGRRRRPATATDR